MPKTIKIKSHGMTNSSMHRQEKNGAVDMKKVFESRFPTTESLSSEMKYFIQNKDMDIMRLISKIGNDLLTIYEVFKDDELV